MADIATIERHRGDTYSNDITINKSDGTPLDVTGYTIVMTVSKDREPVDDTNQLFQLTGTLVTPSAGLVRFTPTLMQANQTPGKYWYDIQLTSGAGAIRTLGPGAYIFRQDITKT